MYLITGSAVVSSFIVSWSLASSIYYGRTVPLAMGIVSSFGVGGVTFSVYVVDRNAGRAT